MLHEDSASTSILAVKVVVRLLMVFFLTYFAGKALSEASGYAFDITGTMGVMIGLACTVVHGLWWWTGSKS